MEKDYLFLLKLAQSHTEPHSSGHQYFLFLIYSYSTSKTLNISKCSFAIYIIL